MSVNKVIILGTVGRDPEVKYMPNGTAVTQLSLATNRKVKNQESGNWEDTTEWHRVVFFDKKAEAIGQYIKKGRQLFVEGRLQTRKWEKDGIERYTTEIIAYEFSFVGNKSDNVEGESTSGSDKSQGFDQTVKQKEEYNQDASPQQDDEIPF
tara:strand:+ start:537 stop:992 length:456 start_codon:yes stop_codon:yes gene_type:complete